MRYTLSYRQTPEERFKSDMNVKAAELIEAHGLTLEGQAGGTALGRFADNGSDQSFYVQGSHATVLAVQRHLAQVLGRQVTRTFADPPGE